MNGEANMTERETFTAPNEAIVTFFDEDGYEFKVTVANVRDATNARDRASVAARERILEGDWRPHGRLLIGGLEVNPTSGERPTASRYAAAAAWRAQAAGQLQAAITELEGAATVMPVSRERVLIDRALRATAQTFRECTRNLEIARRQLGVDPDAPIRAIGAER
jgi:hypothetical protein